MVKLTTKERLNQLENSIKLIYDALQRIDQDKRVENEYFITLAAQLRSLICLGNRNFHPLLIELANKYNYPLICYGPKEIIPQPNLVAQIQIGVPVFICDKPIAPKKYLLKDWLNAKIFYLQQSGELGTPNEVLRDFADKEASHFDPNLNNSKAASLKGIIRSEVNGITNIPDQYTLLGQTGTYVIMATQGLFKHLNI